MNSILTPRGQGRFRSARSRILPVGAGPVLACLLLGGCLDPEMSKQMAEQDSVLAPLMHQTTPTEAAEWASNSYDADKRARGTALLVYTPFGGQEPYLALYRKYVTDESTNVRAVAARGLGQHGQPEDAVLLVPLLKDKERTVRLEAAHALQRLHNPACVEGLVDRLDPVKEAEPAVRAACATALGQYATNRVLQALIAALADDTLVVTDAAYESLRTLTGQDQLTDDRREWAHWVSQTREPFTFRREYVYPVFQRDKRWLDYMPFMPTVPNETAARPMGMPEVASATATTSDGTPGARGGGGEPESK